MRPSVFPNRRVTLTHLRTKNTGTCFDLNSLTSLLCLLTSKRHFTTQTRENDGEVIKRKQMSLSSSFKNFYENLSLHLRKHNPSCYYEDDRNSFTIDVKKFSSSNFILM